MRSFFRMPRMRSSGFRIPSFKGRVSARTSFKRKAVHGFGLKMPKGMGILRNPKKAIYNRVYKRITFGIFDSSRSYRSGGPLGVGRSSGFGSLSGTGSVSAVEIPHVTLSRSIQTMMVSLGLEREDILLNDKGWSLLKKLGGKSCVDLWQEEDGMFSLRYTYNSEIVAILGYGPNHKKGVEYQECRIARSSCSNRAGGAVCSKGTKSVGEVELLGFDELEPIELVESLGLDELEFIEPVEPMGLDEFFNIIGIPPE